MQAYDLAQALEGADYMGVFSQFVTIAELKFESIIRSGTLTGPKFESTTRRSSQVYPFFASMFH